MFAIWPMRILDVRAARSAPSRIGFGKSPALIGPKVVFSEPHGLEAELLGQNGLLSEVVNHLLGVGGLSGGRCHCRERSKFHVWKFPFACLLSVFPVMVSDSSPKRKHDPTSQGVGMRRIESLNG